MDIPESSKTLLRDSAQMLEVSLTDAFKRGAALHHMLLKHCNRGGSIILKSKSGKMETLRIV